jgi:two-component system CheB/CheR fusion protein
VVGVGASAGGLEAFRELLAHVPADSGLAFVLVQHLESTRASGLSDALSRTTSMRVTQAKDGDRVAPGRVHVIPPGAQMAIEQGVLRLTPLRENERRPQLPIDFFLRSLAAACGRRAIAVVLSGTASDGTAGLSAVRAAGGITLVQDPRSARFGAMPQNAVDAGVVDLCLPLPALGAELARLARHPYLAGGEVVPATPAGAASLALVVDLVTAATGVDFGEHREATFRRRLARRMVVRKARDVASYLETLRLDPAEVLSLRDDLIVQSTSFFRDEESFRALGAVAFPKILEGKAPGAPVRAWVVGCATGEEVYSLAITLAEHLGPVSGHPILIFGTDLDDKALERARAGVYPDAAVQDLGEERLKRFFVRTGQGWRVSQAIREMCVFARHDVARDPPFSRLDLMTCRTALIHFGQALQRRVLALAHFCLLQPGFLLLGPSEGIGGALRWFTPLRRGGELFARKDVPSRFRFAPRAGGLPPREEAAPAHRSALHGVDDALRRHADEAILARYGPPGVLVNDELEVVQFRGRTGPYLEPPAGEPQSDVLRMAQVGLAAPLRIALAQARRTSEPVRKSGLGGKAKGRAFDLVVLPVKGAEPGGRAFLVLFEERAAPDRDARSRAPAPGRAAARRREMEEELSATKDYVATLLEEHGRVADALASANHGLVAGNEELQSLNEELETAREELQATNEELSTVNDELHGRNQELQLVNADVLALLDAVEIPILVLDEQRRIRRLNRRAATSLGLTPGDEGRRLTDLTLPIRAPDVGLWITKSMKEGILVEAEVQDGDDRWQRLQIRPHHGAGGRADGVILSLVDIDDLRHQVVNAQSARDYANRIVEAVQVPLVVLDAGLRVLSANAAYYREFQALPDQTEGHGFFEMGDGAWRSTELHAAVDSVLAGNGRFQGLEVASGLPGDGHRIAAVSGCVLPTPAGMPLVLLSIEERAS